MCVCVCVCVCVCMCVCAHVCGACVCVCVCVCACTSVGGQCILNTYMLLRPSIKYSSFVSLYRVAEVYCIAIREF